MKAKRRFIRVLNKLPRAVLEVVVCWLVLIPRTSFGTNTASMAEHNMESVPECFQCRGGLQSRQL